MAQNGGVRVSLALNQGALVADPDWTDITALEANLVAGYEINRGREFELDQTDTGSYTVTVKDRNGILDVTNSSSPIYGGDLPLGPDLQILVELWNPVTEEWSTRFRGWTSTFDYTLDPSGRIGFLNIRCYDIFALLTRIEMQPGQFGDQPPGAAAGGRDGVIFFDDATFKGRIDQVGTNAIGATAWAAFAVVFTGNVNLLEGLHSPGENPMDPIQQACDGEFPGVSNVYPDRFGRLAAHGRLAKFDPAGTWLSIAGDDASRDALWAWRHWKIGDDAACAASPGTYAQLRPPFSWALDDEKVINSALAYPKNLKERLIADQYVDDAVSKGIRGYMSWSKENLLTKSGILTGKTGPEECKAFGQFYVNNYAEPRNRFTALSTATVRPSHPTAAETWAMLCGSDIGDRVDVTVSHPGGGGFNLEPGFIEGIHETAVPHDGVHAYVTQSYDVSPMAYFTGDLAGLDGA